MRKRRHGRLLAMVLCVVLALSSTGMAVFASASGEEQIEIVDGIPEEESVEPGLASEGDGSPEEDPDFYEDGPGEPDEVSMEVSGTSGSSDAAGQGQPESFWQSYQSGDTVITLTAEGGVFPEGEGPVLESLQDDTLLRQAEEAAVPVGTDDSRVIFSHAMYSLTGTSMNGIAHILMESCGLAGLRAGGVH